MISISSRRVLSTAFFVFTPLFAAPAQQTYQSPPADLIRILEAPANPVSSISPNRQWILVTVADPRTITISGASKTFSVTGWRVGWAIAPSDLAGPIRKMHDFLTVAAAAGLGAGLGIHRDDPVPRPQRLPLVAALVQVHDDLRPGLEVRVAGVDPRLVLPRLDRVLSQDPQDR